MIVPKLKLHKDYDKDYSLFRTFTMQIVNKIGFISHDDGDDCKDPVTMKE